MNYKIWLTIAAILIGVLFAQASFFGLLKFGLLLLILFIISLFSLVVALFERNQKIIKNNLWFLGFLFLTGISTSIFPNFFTMYQESMAQDLIVEIEAYKKAAGHYPANLEDLDKKSREQSIYYKVDSTLKNYTLSYSLDGWHHRSYSSENKKWIVND